MTTRKNFKAGFRKYTRREHEALWDIPKREILEDLIRRNGVQRRRFKPIELPDEKVRKVRIISRTSAHGGTWYYLRIQGFPPFTTKIRVDISSAKDQQEADPDNWWRISKHAELLRVELQSAESFISMHEEAASPSVPPPPKSILYFRHALSMWGYDGAAFARDMIENETGFWQFVRLCERYFTPTPEAEKLYNEAVSFDEIDGVPLEKWDKEAERFAQGYIHWQPGDPIDLDAEDGPASVTYALSRRFMARYPEAVQSIRTRSSES